MLETNELFEDALALLKTQALRLKNLNGRFFENRLELVQGMQQLYPHLPEDWVNSFQEIMKKDNEMVAEYGEIITSLTSCYNDFYLEVETTYKEIKDGLEKLKESNG